MIGRPLIGRPVVVAAIALALAAAGCATTSSPPVDAGSPSAVPTVPSASPTAPAPTASPAPTDPTTPAGLVTVDRILLDVLPTTVRGLTLVASPEAEAGIAADPDVAVLIARFASAIAVDPQTGDFVFATVLAPHPGVLSDVVYRDYRDSFDEGACSQAGGVVGNAEAEIGGRIVHIGSCEGGLHTYHAWLEDRDLLVSASSIGEARLGELLMEDLR